MKPSMQTTELDVRQLMQTQHLTQEEAQAQLDRDQRELDRQYRLDSQQREIDHQENINRVQDYEGAIDQVCTVYCEHHEQYGDSSRRASAPDPRGTEHP